MITMKKTLVRFFGVATLVCGSSLLALPAYADSSLTVDPIPALTGTVRSSLTLTIHVSGEATGVTVSFSLPKGMKVDGNCLVSHEAGGIRSYTCLAGDITPEQPADVTLSLSSNKPVEATEWLDVTCDSGFTAAVTLQIFIN
jgi:hypothetical protein